MPTTRAMCLTQMRLMSRRAPHVEGCCAAQIQSLVSGAVTGFAAAIQEGCHRIAVAHEHKMAAQPGLSDTLVHLAHHEDSRAGGSEPNTSKRAAFATGRRRVGQATARARSRRKVDCEGDQSQSLHVQIQMVPVRVWELPYEKPRICRRQPLASQQGFCRSNGCGV